MPQRITVSSRQRSLCGAAKNSAAAAYKILEIEMSTYPNSLQQFEDFIDTSIRESIEDQKTDDTQDDSGLDSDQRSSGGDSEGA